MPGQLFSRYSERVSLSSTLKQSLPESILELVRTVYWRGRTRIDFAKDYRRYRKYAMTDETTAGHLDGVHLEAQLTRDYHRVEKSFTLTAPRQPFGSALLHRLNVLLPTAEKQDPPADYVAAARSARAALLQWNAGGDIDDGVAHIANDEPRLSSIQAMFTTRHSVRDYSDKPVDEGLLIEAARLAGMSPSVCNRSPWQVRFYCGLEARRVLQYQYGNSGIDVVPAVAVISVELGYFAGSGERNQPFIDGGIFATSLMWALHGIGLDSCMLNLSLPTPQTDQLRKAIGMTDSEIPIMMMVIGYGRPGHRVARSPRRAIEDIAHITSVK